MVLAYSLNNEAKANRSRYGNRQPWSRQALLPGCAWSRFAYGPGLDGESFVEHSRKWINWQHRKVLVAIARCRTAALGGHRDRCTGCGHTTAISYNSCRNRHCPRCQGNARLRWLQARERELLPTRYVHAV